MTKFVYTLGLLICGNLLFATSPKHVQQIAQSVLSKLYQAHGNHSCPQPKLLIIENNKEAASYRKKDNSILLNVKTFEVCQTFGADSLDALAFILAHELTHAFQFEAHLNHFSGSTGFLAYDVHPSSSTELEKGADIQGVLIAYLAGFQTAQLLPDLMSCIYDTYGLTHTELKGYPSLKERKEIAKEVLDQVEDLIHLFEAGNYLLTAGEYGLATYCFEYVLKTYQGREVYHNLGVSYALQALNFAQGNQTPFVYPFEIDWQSRLRKPSAIAGSRDFSPQERRLRLKYFQHAQNSLQMAAEMSPQEIKTHTNLLCILNLSGDYFGTIDYYQRHLASKLVRRKQPDNTSIIRAQMVLAIAYAKVGNQTKAVKLMQGLNAKKLDINLTAQLKHNLAALTNKHTQSFKVNEEDCSIQLEIDNSVLCSREDFWQASDQILLNKREALHFSYHQTRKTAIYIFKKGGVPIFSMDRNIPSQPIRQAVPSLQKEFLNGMKTARGYVIPCLAERKIYLVTPDNQQIIEWVAF